MRHILITIPFRAKVHIVLTLLGCLKFNSKHHLFKQLNTEILKYMMQENWLLHRPIIFQEDWSIVWIVIRVSETCRWKLSSDHRSSSLRKPKTKHICIDLYRRYGYKKKGLPKLARDMKTTPYISPLNTISESANFRKCIHAPYVHGSPLNITRHFW